MNFYISDLHLFHDNILNLCDRPFENIQDMHDTIAKNWKKAVSPGDTVFILGDVGLYHEKEIRKWLDDLPGKKILIKGNHDVYQTKSKTFCGAFTKITSYLEVKDQGRIVALFHYPIEEWNGFFRNRYHLHGHVHNKEETLKLLDRRFNVSVDVIGYCPRTLDELIKMRKEGNANE